MYQQNLLVVLYTQIKEFDHLQMNQKSTNINQINFS